MLISNFRIVCNECGKKYKISSDSLDVSYVYDERQMGTEIQHNFYGEMECSCGNRLSYTVTAVEYPEGAYNCRICNSIGCSYIENPRVDMEYELEEELEYLLNPVWSFYEVVFQNPKYVYNLEPWEFEKLVAEIFEKKGFDAEVTQRTRDGGKDIIATFEKGGVRYTTYFECKRYAPNKPVGVEVVRNLYAVMNKEQVDKGVIVTTSHFTKDAVKEAKQLGRIRLIDFNELCDLMRDGSDQDSEYNFWE